MTTHDRSDPVLRVLVENDSSDLRNGAVNDVFDLASYASSSTVRFYLCGTISPEAERLAASRGMTVILAASVNLSKAQPFVFAGSVVAWCARLVRLRPHVVHLNYRGWSPSLGLAAYLLGIPVVARAGAYDKDCPANRWVRAYVANGRSHAAAVLASPLASLVRITGPIFRIDRLHNANVPVRPIPEKHGPRFLFLGQIIERKGVHVLIDAFSRVPRPAELMIVGGDWNSSGLAQRLREQITSNGLDGRVLLENHRPDIGALLSAADALVLPALSDAQPRAIIEAMLAGLPVVSTVVGGIPELVDDGHTGLLVEPGNAAALAEAIARLSGSAELRHQFGAAGRSRAETQFRPEDTATAYVSVYREVSRR